MRALLRVLLLVLTASVGNYLFPTLPADGNGQNQQHSRSELGLPDCQGLPGTSESPAVQRTFGDASARRGPLPQKQTDGLASGAAGSEVGARRFSSSQLPSAVSRTVVAFQTHLRTNGTANANGSRA